MDIRKPILVGLMGPQQGQNDVACDYLVKIGFKRISIADEIKTCATAFGWAENKAHVENQNKKILGAVAKCGREIHPDYWTLNVLKKVIEEKGTSSIVIPDIRTKSEADTVRSVDGYTVFVGTTRVIEEFKQSDKADMADYFIHDLGTKGELHHAMMLGILKIYEDGASAVKKSKA